ncbi:UDP-N-acetylglucosamine--dolichyl-phosphate N-acetylglucosaminephosphotransferase [Chlorella vulgaris]
MCQRATAAKMFETVTLYGTDGRQIDPWGNTSTSSAEALRTLQCRRRPGVGATGESKRVLRHGGAGAASTVEIWLDVPLSTSTTPRILQDQTFTLMWFEIKTTEVYVDECPDSSLERTALYLQQRSLFKPSAGESAAALEARYEPITEVCSLQLSRDLEEADVGTECHNPKEMYCAILKGANGPDPLGGQELPDGVVICNPKQRVSGKAMLDGLARLEAADFSPLVDLLDRPPNSRPHRRHAGAHAWAAVLCDLQQFCQQRQDAIVQHKELKRQEEEGSVTAEQGAAWPGQAAAANNAGKSTRSSILSAGPTAPLARKNQPWTAQIFQEAWLHTSSAQRPARSTACGAAHSGFWTCPAGRGDPRLAGVTSLRVRTAVVRSDGKVDLTHAIAGAKYALDFDKTITRSQLVAVRSPSSGRSYLANVLDLHCASLLGTGNGLDAGGSCWLQRLTCSLLRNVLASRARAVTMYDLLAPSGCSSSPTEAGCLQVDWDDAAALRGHVLSRLLDVNMQCKLRSIVSHLSTAASRLAPALLAIAGVDCFDPSVSWAHGATSKRGGLDSEKWRQAVSSRSKEAADMLQLILDSRMLGVKQARCLLPNGLLLFGIPDERVRYSVLVSLAISVVGFLLTLRLIPVTQTYTLKAGLSGLDMNKLGSKEGAKRVPEALGLVSGVVFLVCIVLFQQLHFYDSVSLVQSIKTGEWHEVVRDSRKVEAAGAGWLVDYNAALATICFMLFLGFADDVLDIPWRVKLILPCIASLPLLIAYTGGTGVVVPDLLCNGPLNMPAYLELGVIYKVQICPRATLKNSQRRGWGCLAGWDGWIVSSVLATGLLPQDLSSVEILVENIRLFGGPAVLFHNLLALSRGAGDTPEQQDGHLFAAYLMMPLVATTLALLVFNWFPAKVFVGDTFTYFAGMTLAVAGILGHFSETLLLFFIPQIINFVYSLPQLFKFVPCPRHRLPRFDSSTGLLHATPNMNVVNLTLRLLGPCSELWLCMRILIMQILICLAVLTI